MSNRIRGTTTNMTKLVAWDIDEYNDFSNEEDCFIILSPQEKYLLKNALRQVKWSTRWTSELGTPQPNREEIAENMAYKLSQEYCVDFCQAIIDCIEDPNSGVSTSIINAVGNTQSPQQIELGQGQSGISLGGLNNPTCDKDIMYGGILQMVETLNDNNVDALQIFEVATNHQEWVANVAFGIAGVEIPVVQSMLDWALYVQNNIKENYDAQWTNAYRDTVVCDLLCIAMDNCELTPQMLVDYFFERLSSQLSFGSLITESLEFIVLGVWVGTEIVDAFMLSQLVFRAQFGNWFEYVAFNSIDLDMRLGFDDPSNDWSLICSTCDTLYTINFDVLFTVDWSITADKWGGTLIIAPVIQDTFGNPQPSALSARVSGTGTFGLSLVVRVELVAEMTVESVDFDYYYTTPYANNTLGRRALLLDSGFNQLSGYVNTGNNAPKSQWNTVDGSPVAPVANVKYVDIVIQVTSAAVSTYANCRGWIDNIKIEGVL
jgi:hypothetical protein